jgi:Sulfatase
MADAKDKPEKQESLPFPPTPSASIAGRTMQESVYKQRVTPRRLPADAPNILIVLIDDAGPALPATFGGKVQTPTMDRIVKEGIAYNRFHTTAMCSPTRASLLTGRNHHRVGNGQIAEMANDWDGYSGKIPRSSALAPEVLKDYGYATAAWGKWHNTPAEETTSAGPFENWPTSLGFEYFYGFLAGEASQTSRTLCATRPTSSSRRRWRKATTSAKTWRTTRLDGCTNTRPFSRISHSSCIGRAARSTVRITSQRSGRISTRASSTTAGTPTASAFSSAPRRRAGFPPTLNSPRGTRRCPPGTASQRTRGPSSAA